MDTRKSATGLLECKVQSAMCKVNFSSHFCLTLHSAPCTLHSLGAADVGYEGVCQDVNYVDD